jgi:hypothetical protein
MKQLRFTTTEPTGMAGIFSTPSDLLVTVDNVNELINNGIKGRTAYIHADAENLAGFDIPHFIDGDMGQLDLPIGEQNIVMLLKNGEYKCQAVLQNSVFAQNAYLITLKK